MRTVVDAAQPFAVDVAVDLRRRQGAVPEQLLDRAQVGAALQQMRRERVAQSMRMREHSAHRRGVEAPTTRGHEERVLSAVDERGARVLQVPRDAVRGLLAERNDAFLSTFAADSHVLLLEVDVAEVEADRLVTPQAR